MSSVLSATARGGKLSVEQYLAFERASPNRHEYFDGEILAMAGEKLPHGIASTNIVGLLYAQLKGTPCIAVTKDTKVRSGLGVVSVHSVSGMFSYPDVLVICGAPEFFDEQSDIIVNPTVIFEVLSDSTELFDRGEKFQRYRVWNKSLKEYVLVSQTKALIEHYRLEPDDSWNLQESRGLDANVVLPSISCTLRLADIYDRIQFDEDAFE